jgi:beta-glucuronidase
VALLAPRESRSRECHRLDGLWRFRLDPGGEGTAGGWWRAPLCDAREMAVPASYNDLVTDAAEREHVGDVWYQRDVWVPAAWEGKRIVLRCDAATHRGTLWAGDVEVADHVGGYTPFEADVTDHVRGGEPLRVTVRMGNELTMATIPPGVISVTADGRAKQRYFHDFSTMRACTGRYGCIRPRGTTWLTSRSAPRSTRGPGPAA